MVLTNNQSKKLKEVQLDLLKNFINVCEKLNLEYFVIGGTLIGAVRHKGFIPWDDDIDIAMKREDYEVFIKKGQKHLSDKYFVQTIYSDPKLPFNFCKIRNSETTWIEESIKNFKINHGVGIDVFPLDFYPEDKNFIKAFQRKQRLLSVIISRKFSFPHLNLLSKVKTLSARVLFVFCDISKYVKKREKLYKSIDSSGLLANFSGAWGAKEVAPKEWFDSTIEMEFEGIKVKAPIGYDLWLKRIYGNYMKLPPIEKRVAHHHVKFVDLEKSYREYIK